MNMRFRTFLCACLLATCLPLLARPQAPATEHKSSKTASNSDAERKEGERRFRENCGRCHHQPESISPREVKAVLQHMRVRAMLNAEDERLIMEYLAP